LGLTGDVREIDADMEKVAPKNRIPRCSLLVWRSGIMLLGTTLAEAGMRNGWHSSWIPSYGPEMRGGTANCHVEIASKSIGSPLTIAICYCCDDQPHEKFEECCAGRIAHLLHLSYRYCTKRTDIELLPIPYRNLLTILAYAFAI
jgi:hypothetical protein